jgi:muramidase (phage lysozyme)
MKISASMVAQAKPLLDFIAQPESGGDYNIVWGGIRKADHPRAPLTSMSVGSVLDWQDSIDSKYMSEASGKYQIMEDTLRGLYKSAGMNRASKFDEVGQDRLGVALLNRRGYQSFLAGEMSVNQFANNLAKEWASLPLVTGRQKGRSFYAGDGLNKAHIKVPAFLSAVKASRDVVAEAAPSVAKSTTVQATLAAAGGTIGSVATVLSKLDPATQYILVGFACVALLSLGWIARERVRRWAEDHE